MSTAKLSRAQSTYLNLIRGLAAMAVLFGHAGVLFLDQNPMNRLNIQSAAVLVFFLLSGFLISYSTLRKYDDPSYSFRHYFIDRFCRIYCAFLPALVFVWLVDMYTIALPYDHVTPNRVEPLKWITNLHENFNFHTWIGNLLMMQDFPLFQILRRLVNVDSPLFVDEFGSASPFWTISIEWWIYMAFGGIVLLLIRDGKRFSFLGWLLFGFVMIVPAYYSVGGPDNCLSFLWAMGMAACMVFLQLPVWLASLKKPLTDKIWRYACILVFVGAIIGMAARLLALKFDNGVVAATELQFSVFLMLAIFSMLFFLRGIEKVPVFLEKTCSFVAEYSFSLYLTHATVITYLYLKYPGNDTNPQFYWMAIGISNVVAIIFWWLFERHYHSVAKYLKTLSNKVPAVV